MQKIKYKVKGNNGRPQLRKENMSGKKWTRGEDDVRDANVWSEGKDKNAKRENR